MSSIDCSRAGEFVYFPRLPLEIRLMIWELALPGPRVVSIKQKPLKRTIGEWEDENNRTWPVLDRELVPGQKEQEGGNRAVENITTKRRAKREKKARQWVAVSSKLETVEYRKAPMYGMACETPAPNILLACRESYAVVSKLYERCFSCPLSIPEAYFNFKLDTLYIQYDNMSWHYRNNGVESDFLDLWDGFSFGDFDNIGRVERLAVLVSHRNGYPSFYEETAQKILRVFPCLKNLYLVLEATHNDNDDKAEPFLIESIDPKEGLAVWNSHDPIRKISSWSHFKCEMPTIYPLDPEVLETSMKILRKYQRKDMEKLKVVWNIPEFSGKSTVSYTTKMKLEEAEKNCLKRVELAREQMKDPTFRMKVEEAHENYQRKVRLGLQQIRDKYEKEFGMAGNDA
ncbi:uncharacterized protein PAC_12919 [Phialocephala subalpina]|uniref:2EXR domain-containing protein n=1 Tax=Phialocephala subalpina TaxID=576137 RepID=A0A1L7XDC4_9HELO|nr:uncharacterized protein PAC_12919 [Phialocephala subalpina]